MKTTNINDFMLVVDSNDMIISIFPEDSMFSSFLNMKLEQIVDKDSLINFTIFFQN